MVAARRCRKQQEQRGCSDRQRDADTRNIGRYVDQEQCANRRQHNRTSEQHQDGAPADLAPDRRQEQEAEKERIKAEKEAERIQKEKEREEKKAEAAAKQKEKEEAKAAQEKAKAAEAAAASNGDTAPKTPAKPGGKKK